MTDTPKSPTTKPETDVAQQHRDARPDQSPALPAQVAEVTIAIPFSPSAPTGYHPREMDLHLTMPERDTLARVQDALHGRKCDVPGGSVTTGVDAVRWLIQQCSEQIALSDAAADPN